MKSVTIFSLLLIIIQIVNIDSQCATGEYYDTNNKCSPCSKANHCAKCTDSLYCTGCDSGRILDAITRSCIYPCDEGRYYDKNEDNCKDCSTPNCGECSSDSAHTCVKCMALFDFDSEKKCVKQTRVGGITIVKIDKTKKRYKKPYIACLVLTLIFFTAFVVLLIVYLSLRSKGDEEETKPVAVTEKNE